MAESRQDDSATQAGLGGRRKELAHRRIALEQENNKNQGAGDRIQSASGPSRTKAPAQNSVSAQRNRNLTFTPSSGSTYSLTLNSKQTGNTSKGETEQVQLPQSSSSQPQHLSNLSPVPGSQHPNQHNSMPSTCHLCTAQYCKY